MQTGKILYVRTDYKIEGTTTSKNDFNDHIDYLKEVSEQRFFMGGGFVKSPGGMIVYEADNMIDARVVAENDPLIKRGLYRYELLEWEMVLLSEELLEAK